MFLTSTFSVIRSRSLWSYFHAPVILPYILKAHGLMWYLEYWLCDTTIGSITNVGHLNLYFMVQFSWSVVRDWTACRVQASCHVPSVALELAATASSAMAASTGSQEMQWAQALDKRPWLQMYKVLGNCTPLGWQTTEGSPGRTWQAWGGSFLLLPRRHALSSRWLWTFNHNMCENRLEEVQGSATISFFMPPLFQNTWPCVQLLCVERNATLPARLGHWQPNLQRMQQNDRAMIIQICNVRQQDIVTTRSNELHVLARLGIEDLDLILKERRLWWYGHVERSNGAVKTAFDIQVDGKRGTGRPKMTWKQLTERDCREWKLSAINPHDRHTWRSGVRSVMHAASQLSGSGAHWCGCCPCTCT